MIDITFPETRTISSRLTWSDYRNFRTLCLVSGTTMHRVIRLLVGRWMMEKSGELRMPGRISERLRRGVDLERERKDGIYPLTWDCRPIEQAAATLSAAERMFDALVESGRYEDT